MSTAERPDGQVATVYALVDPRTEQTRYVGVTRWPVEVRLAGHYRSMTDERPSLRAKNEWLRELGAAALAPRVRILERVATDQRYRAELRWIRRLAADGAPLINERGVDRVPRIARRRAPPAAADGETWSTWQAAAVLDVSERTVRRYIKTGLLAGSTAPAPPGQVAYNTTREAVEACKEKRDTERVDLERGANVAAPDTLHNANPAADTITTDEAAGLLGCSERSVRRYIAAGKLPGRRAPAGPGQVAYTTTTKAVTDFKSQRDAQQRHSGAIVDTVDTVDNARDPRLTQIHRNDAPSQGTERRTPNAAIAVPNAERRTPNAAEQRQEQLLDQLASRLEAVQAALAHDRAAALEAQLQVAHEKVAALARENGRLQAELAHAQAALAPPAPATGETAGAERPHAGWIVRLLWWRRDSP